MSPSFEKWRRGRTAAYRGTGMGLAIARAVAEAHGGALWAESTLGAGSAFHFSCPAKERSRTRPVETASR